MSLKPTFYKIFQSPRFKGMSLGFHLWVALLDSIKHLKLFIKLLNLSPCLCSRLMWRNLCKKNRYRRDSLDSGRESPGKTKNDNFNFENKGYIAEVSYVPFNEIIQWKFLCMLCNCMQLYAIVVFGINYMNR